MANLAIHINDCMHLIGNGHKDVHIWLDECTNEYPVEKYGVFHRTIRHNIKGIHKILAKYGIAGGIAAIIHILRDRDGICPTIQDLNEIFLYGIPEIDWVNI